jgi:hypothetical protein
MKVKYLSVGLVAAASLAACQSPSTYTAGAVKNVWAGKTVTPVTLSVVSNGESRGKEITYKLSKQANEGRVTLIIDNAANVPLELHSVTISGDNENSCIVQTGGGYQLPANKQTAFDFVDIGTFESCLYGTNKAQSGRYQVAVNHNGQFSAGPNTSTRGLPFVMTIDYSVGATKTVSNLVGFTYYTTGI